MSAFLCRVLGHKFAVYIYPTDPFPAETYKNCVRCTTPRAVVDGPTTPTQETP